MGRKTTIFYTEDGRKQISKTEDKQIPRTKESTTKSEKNSSCNYDDHLHFSSGKLIISSIFPLQYLLTLPLNGKDYDELHVNI